jgi:hypothetical protein
MSTINRCLSSSKFKVDAFCALASRCATSLLLHISYAWYMDKRAGRSIYRAGRAEQSTPVGGETGPSPARASMEVLS